MHCPCALQSTYPISLVVSFLQLISREFSLFFFQETFFLGNLSMRKLPACFLFCFFCLNPVCICRTVWQFIVFLAYTYLCVLTVFSQWLMDRMLSRNLMPFQLSLINDLDFCLAAQRNFFFIFKFRGLWYISLIVLGSVFLSAQTSCLQESALLLEKEHF